MWAFLGSSMRAGEAAEVVAQTYDALIQECNDCIFGLQNQHRMVSDSRDTMTRTNDTTRVALSLFANLLSKKHLDKRDLHLIVDHIVVYEDRIEVKLRSGTDASSPAWHTMQGCFYIC